MYKSHYNSLAKSTASHAPIKPQPLPSRLLPRHTAYLPNPPPAHLASFAKLDYNAIRHFLQTGLPPRSYLCQIHFLSTINPSTHTHTHNHPAPARSTRAPAFRTATLQQRRTAHAAMPPPPPWMEQKQQSISLTRSSGDGPTGIAITLFSGRGKHRKKKD